MEKAKCIKEDFFELELPFLIYARSLVTMTLKIGNTNYDRRLLKLESVAPTPGRGHDSAPPLFIAACIDS